MAWGPTAVYFLPMSVLEPVAAGGGGGAAGGSNAASPADGGEERRERVAAILRSDAAEKVGMLSCC